jgi:hypothetical protein
VVNLHRVIKIIMLPFIVSTFLIGWCISWKGERNKIQTNSPVRTFPPGHLRTSYAVQNSLELSPNKQTLTWKA